MKKTNNKSNKLVKVTYEYFGDKFVRNPMDRLNTSLTMGKSCVVSGTKIGIKGWMKCQKMRLRNTSPFPRNLKLAEIL